VTVPDHDMALLPGEWRKVQPPEAAELEQELRREVPQGHVLHGVRVHAVAVRRHLKDVVFWVPTSKQWALVHLTGRPEDDPHWPSTFCARRWEDVSAELSD
jgi:hypothetical protein